jgi:hypothetical protein
MSMKRIISEPPPAANAEPSDDVTKLVARYLPSWLASLVVHLALVLLLALVVVHDAGWKSEAIALRFESGADALADGLGQLEDAIEMPSQLPAESAEDPTETLIESLAEDAVDAPRLELAEMSRASLLAGLTSGKDEGTAGSAGGEGINLGPVRTEVFGLAAEGSRFVYVFDRSESMNSELAYTSEGTTVFSITPLQAAKAELLRSLDDLETAHEFGIVFYNHSPWLFTLDRKSRSVLPATPENKRRAGRFVSSMYGQGKTNHMKPLEIALRMRPDVIFLLTDGEQKDDLNRTELKRLSRLNDGRTRINVVQFCYKTQTESELVDLAKDNGGQHVFFNIARLGPTMIGQNTPPSP